MRIYDSTVDSSDKESSQTILTFNWIYYND